MNEIKHALFGSAIEQKKRQTPEILLFHLKQVTERIIFIVWCFAWRHWMCVYPTSSRNYGKLTIVFFVIYFNTL